MSSSSTCLPEAGPVLRDPIHSSPSDARGVFTCRRTDQRLGPSRDFIHQSVPSGSRILFSLKPWSKPELSPHVYGIFIDTPSIPGQAPAIRLGLPQLKGQEGIGGSS